MQPDVPSDRGSVTQWIGKLQEGPDSVGEQELWSRYFERLVALARKKLAFSSNRESDEEDAALDAMNSFYRRMQKGQFPDLKDREGLWPLLVKITVRKVLNQQRKAGAAKRKGSGESVLGTTDDRPLGFDDLAGSEPSPDMLASTLEETNELIDALEQDSLKEVALLKLEGFTHREIAEKLGVIERTVERRVVLIRKIWSEKNEVE